MAEVNKRRVKLYRLNPNGDWDDLGTGFVELLSVRPSALSPTFTLS